MKIYDVGLVVSYTLFPVFCGLFIMGMLADRKLSELGTSSIAPENLRRAAESFRLNFIVEKQSKNLEDFSKSESWMIFENGLSDYADRIELLHEQRYFRNSVIMWSYGAVGLLMFFFTTARKREVARKAQQNAAEQPASRPTVSNK